MRVFLVNQGALPVSVNVPGGQGRSASGHLQVFLDSF